MSRRRATRKRRGNPGLGRNGSGGLTLVDGGVLNLESYKSLPVYDAALNNLARPSTSAVLASPITK